MEENVSKRKFIMGAGLSATGVALLGASPNEANAATSNNLTYVNDYTALRALNSSQLNNGEIIFVTDDGLAGQFIVKSGLVPDNGGTVIVFSDNPNKYAERRYTGAVYVDWFEGVVDSSDASSGINNAFAYAASTEGKSIAFSPRIYNITSTIGRTTSEQGGTVHFVYGNGAIINYVGTSIALEFYTDAPNIYDLRIRRLTVGDSLYEDFTGSYGGTVGISAPIIRSKIWANIFIEGFAFGVDQNIDQHINSSYRSSRSNIYNIDVSGNLVGWNTYCANDGWLTNFAFHKFRYAGDSVKDGEIKMGTGFRGYNDGSPQSDAYPRAVVFHDCVIENAKYAIRMNTNGWGNALHSPYMEHNDYNVFFEDNPNNPLAQWSVFGDQDQSANILSNPDYSTQKHTVITAGHDTRIHSDAFFHNGGHNYNGEGKTSEDLLSIGRTLNLDSGLQKHVASGVVSQLSTQEVGAGAISEFYRNETYIGAIRVTSGDNFAIQSQQDLSFFTSGDQSLKVDRSTGSGDTRLWVYDADKGSLQRVTVGEADSAGLGYKVLRVPN